MRKWLIFIILLLFNILLISGINSANVLMFNNNFMIYLYPEDRPENVDDENNTQDVTEEPVDTSFNGESIEEIGKKMDTYMAKTPLEGYGEYIAKASISKSVNPYLIGGIILESTSCKSECSTIFNECNNVSGMKGSPGCFGGSYKRYNQINEGILDIVNLISKDYYTPEMQAPYKMYKQYGKSSVWAFKVSKYMEELKRGK